MVEDIKLSIIIPYYDTYKLTASLMNELVHQLNYQVEIILVDDGCNEYMFDQYAEFIINTRIIHQENGGVSKARNKGIELAKGEYIAFVDSDDMIMPNYVDTLLDLIKERKEDIIYFNWLDINTNEVVRHPSNPAVWKAIYKKDIVPKFDETLKTREDYFFNEELDKQEHTKYYYDKVLYIYNSGREDGLTSKSERGEL